MDNNVYVDQNDWAVTLTCDKGRADFHSHLFFEGMTTEKVDSYFFRVAHLMGHKMGNLPGPKGPSCGTELVGHVEIGKEKERENFEVKYRAKSETWIRSRKKIERLLVEIEKEALGEHPFMVLGGRSFAAKKAEIFNIYDPLLGELHNLNARLFLRLYDSAINGGECTGMSQKQFDQAIAKLQGPIEKLFPGEKLTYGSLIERTRNFSEKLNKSQQSCITWCLDKLEVLDIKFPVSKLEKLISVTTLYTSKKAQNCAQSCLISTVKPGKWDGFKIYKRFLTYDTSRDLRTEDWKLVEKKAAKNHIIAVAADATGSTAYTIGCFALMAIPAAASAPIALGLSAVGLVSVFVVPHVTGRIHASALKKQNQLLEDVSSNNKFKQPGNDSTRQREIKPYFFDRWAAEPDSEISSPNSWIWD